MKNTLSKFLSIGLIAIGLAACGSSTTAPLTTVGASTAGAVNLTQTNGIITFSGVGSLNTLITASSSTGTLILGAAQAAATGGSMISYIQGPTSYYANAALSMSGALVSTSQISFGGTIQLSQYTLQVIEQNMGGNAIITGMDLQVDQIVGQGCLYNTGYTGYSSCQIQVTGGAANLYINGQPQPVQIIL